MNTVAAKIEINRLFWFKLTRELHRRGANEQESGAFLLSRERDTEVVRFVCYDDLDPYCLDSGIVRFDGAGYVKLWQICQKEKLHVVADVHTHPGKWTDQSELDKTHPMIPQKGHTALIVPRFARGSRFGLRGVGIFEYLGDGEWRQWSVGSGKVRLICL
jgi:proteasome lid subunit RPN8/RPN11